MSAAPGEVERLLEQGRAREALLRLDARNVSRPGPSERFQRGIALALLGRNQEAVSVYRQLIEEHPDMPAAYNNLAVLLNNQGQHEQAREVLEQGLRASVEHAALYRNLGNLQLYLARERQRKAFPVLGNVSAAAPRLAMLRQAGKAAAVQAPAVAAPMAVQPAWRVATAQLEPVPWRRAGEPVVPLRAPDTVTALAPAPAPAPAPVAAPVAAPAPAPFVAPVSAPVVSSTPASVVTPPPVAPAAVAAAVVSQPAAQPAAPTAERAKDDVRAALTTWASAWSRRDIDAYLAAYADDHRGQSASRDAWVRERRDRIVGRRDIRVSLSDINIDLKADVAVVRLRQDYRSEVLHTVSRKTLTLRLLPSGQWKIEQESSGSQR